MLVFIINLLTILVLVVVGGTVSLPISLGIAFLFPSVHEIPVSHHSVIAAIILVVWLAAVIAWLVSTLRMAWTYMNLFFNVKSFKVYVKDIPSEIRDKELETLVEIAAGDRAIPMSSWARFRSKMDELKPDAAQIQGSKESAATNGPDVHRQNVSDAGQP